MFSFLRGRNRSRCSRRSLFSGKCACKKKTTRNMTFEPLEQRQMLSITWNGQGGDNLWSNGANWVGGVAPTAGEDLVFNWSSQTSTQNDLSHTFKSLTFTSSNFSVGGNTVALTDGITVNSGVVNTSILAGVEFSIGAKRVR